MICPKDLKPCCDDLCYGGGCLAMGGYPMLERCQFCKGLIDRENPDYGTCTCDPDGDEYGEGQCPT